ncbi:hypothetical protein Ddye_032059 [Dipteronia dyeriana]|uniref:AB hydrolase-1 domain-containing protein n=1 Tax=Dipteronia dyeriana TaxID=168575 RepID=A0AAD9TJJ9_9ROSI|nr:hypothetical protein Ddye_032059 [Dipteronia dyeriana]
MMMMTTAPGAVNSISLNYLHQHYGHNIINARRHGGSGSFNVKQPCNSNFKPNSNFNPSLIISTTVSTRTTSLHVSASSSSAAPGGQFSDQWVDAKKKQSGKRIAGIDQDELLDPKVLADADSCFCEFKGVHIHHKVYDAESKPNNSLQNQALTQLPQQIKKIGFPMILLHGFGASVFSWSRVMEPLGEVTGSKVLAFDRPAFGLTSRLFSFHHSSPDSKGKKPLNPYSMAFAVLATLYLVDFLAAEKAILVGHSAGSLVAVNSYFEAPERVAALILVAPAILAPRIVQKVVERNRSERNESNDQIGKERSDLNPINPFIKLLKMLSMFIKYIMRAIMQMAKGMADMINSLYKKALSAFLRSAFALTLLRMVMDKFGLAAVRNAFYDSKKFTEHIADGYTKPLKAKGWDRALLEFTAAMLTDTDSVPKPPVAKRLHEISCPVLIVTGDTDRIVPSWNAERLSRAIPGSKLEVIKHCGHLPHEEKFEEFVSIVERFLQNAFGCSEGKSVQAVV